MNLYRINLSLDILLQQYRILINRLIPLYNILNWIIITKFDIRMIKNKKGQNSIT
jgi:hypothetical protein